MRKEDIKILEENSDEYQEFFYYLAVDKFQCILAWFLFTAYTLHQNIRKRSSDHEFLNEI